MGTKWRSFATNIVTKSFLFALLLGTVYFAAWGTMMMVDTIRIKEYLPSDSLVTMDYTNNWEFQRAGSDIVRAFENGVAPEKRLNEKHLPTYYYRAEFADQTITNSPEGREFFAKHQYHGAYRALPDGSWETLAMGVADRQQGFYSPQGNYDYSIDYFMNNVWGVTEFENQEYASSAADYAPVPTPPIDEDQLTANYQAWLANNPRPALTVYYAFDDASVAEFQAYWQQCRYYYLAVLGSIGGFVLVGLIAGLWLLIACGRRPADREAHLLPIDQLWTEAGFCIMCVFVVLWCGALALYVQSCNYSHLSSALDPVMMHLYCTSFTLCVAGFMAFFLSQVRLIKARRFWKNSLIRRLCRWCLIPFKKLWSMARECFDQHAFRDYPLTQALQKRQLVFFGALGGALGLPLLLTLAFGAGELATIMLLLVAGVAVIAYWQMTGNKKTYEEINNGMSESFAEQVKAERTKTALITNVSHDLKTPLTSIITYTDLLSQEELSDTARDYVTILGQKAERLKLMVADLFDLAKSAGGNIPLTLEVLDLKRLVEQTIADMEDHIEASGLTIKTKLPEGEVNIYADGKKLYRVFQNLIVNTLKYSMESSRVYITMEVTGKQVTTAIKNTSASEMDFTAEEILQRFNRGDKARAGDGNGLGLSIAESFTTACGGSFRLELDGDLFKVTTIFPLTDRKPAPSEDIL